MAGSRCEKRSGDSWTKHYERRGTVSTTERFTIEVGDVSLTKVWDAINEAIEAKYGAQTLGRVYASGDAEIEKVTVVVRVVIPDAPAKPKPDSK
jgi:hypothetical protein